VIKERELLVRDTSDSASALAVVQTQPSIALLITDVGLPGGMNGRQLADAVCMKRKDLKVLFITGYAENATFSSGRLGHGMEVLTKPFALSALTNKVRKMLDT